MTCTEPDPGSGGHRAFSVEVAPDRMAVLFTGPVSEANLDATVGCIADELTRLGVSKPPSTDCLVTLLRDAAREKPVLEGFTLVRGTPPKPPRDGAIEWQGDFFREGFFTDEETGAVDFRRRAAQRSVMADRLLARIRPPEEGRDGEDVFGKRVAVPRAKAVRVAAGPNVRLDEDEGCFYAEASGRLRFTGRVIAVDPLLEIPGSVGLETGNISHPGALTVVRDIEAGSIVSASGDIEVKGVIEAADVESGGSLSVGGGITGVRGRLVVAAGGVHAKFVRDAVIEAGSDIVVEKEAIQSVLKTRGNLVMPRARVIGGEVVALGGIDVYQAGSEVGIPTTLVAGEDYTRAEELREAERQAAALELELAKVRSVLDGPHPPRDAAAIEARAAEIGGQLAQWRARMQPPTDEGGPRRARIVIRGTVYPEVTLRIRHERLRLTEALQGPVQAVLAGGAVALLPVSAERP